MRQPSIMAMPTCRCIIFDTCCLTRGRKVNLTCFQCGNEWQVHFPIFRQSIQCQEQRSGKILHRRTCVAHVEVLWFIRIGPCILNATVQYRVECVWNAPRLGRLSQSFLHLDAASPRCLFVFCLSLIEKFLCVDLRDLVGVIVLVLSSLPSFHR